MRFEYVTSKDFFRAWIIFTISFTVLGSAGAFVITWLLGPVVSWAGGEVIPWLISIVVYGFELVLSFFLFRWAIRRFLLIGGSSPVEDEPHVSERRWQR
jgi:hypothetical protein